MELYVEFTIICHHIVENSTTTTRPAAVRRSVEHNQHSKKTAATRSHHQHANTCTDNIETKLGTTGMEQKDDGREHEIERKMPEIGNRQQLDSIRAHKRMKQKQHFCSQHSTDREHN